MSSNHGLLNSRASEGLSGNTGNECNIINVGGVLFRYSRSQCGCLHQNALARQSHHTPGNRSNLWDCVEKSAILVEFPTDSSATCSDFGSGLEQVNADQHDIDRENIFHSNGHQGSLAQLHQETGNARVSIGAFLLSTTPAGP